MPFLFYLGCGIQLQKGLFRDLGTDNNEQEEDVLQKKDYNNKDYAGDTYHEEDILSSDTPQTSYDVSPLEEIGTDEDALAEPDHSTIDGKVQDAGDVGIADAEDTAAIDSIDDYAADDDTKVKPDTTPPIYLNTVEGCVDYLVGHLTAKGYGAQVIEEGNWEVQIYMPSIDDYISAEAQIKVTLPVEKDGLVSCNFDFYIRCKPSNEGGLSLSSDCPHYQEAAVPDTAESIVEKLEQKLAEWLEEM